MACGLLSGHISYRKRFPQNLSALRGIDGVISIFLLILGHNQEQFCSAAVAGWVNSEVVFYMYHVSRKTTTGTPVSQSTKSQTCAYFGLPFSKRDALEETN